MALQNVEPASGRPGGVLSARMVVTIAKTVLGVGLFSVIAASILAEGTTDRATGASKVALAPSKAEREQMQRLAAQAARGDVVTGSLGALNSVRFDPCAAERKR